MSMADQREKVDGDGQTRDGGNDEGKGRTQENWERRMRLNRVWKVVPRVGKERNKRWEVSSDS